VSRHWTGKTLTEHRADRAAVIHQALEEAGIEAPDARRCAADVLADDGKLRFVWADVAAHEDAYDYAAVIASAVEQAKRWREQYDHAKTVAEQRGSPPGGTCGQSFGNCDQGSGVTTWRRSCGAVADGSGGRGDAVGAGVDRSPLGGAEPGPAVVQGR